MIKIEGIMSVSLFCQEGGRERERERGREGIN